jgi:hypothetical protein
MTAPASIGTGAGQEPEPESGIGGEPEPEPRPERRVGALAITVIILGVLALSLGVYVVAIHNFKPKPKVTYRPAAVFGLHAGDCFNSSQNGSGITVVPCARPHQAEVFATFQLPDSSWPGVDVIQAEASEGCTSRIAGYMSPQFASTVLDREATYPDQLTWQAGVRTVVCDVRSPDGLITGSVRNTS